MSHLTFQKTAVSLRHLIKNSLSLQHLRHPHSLARSIIGKKSLLVNRQTSDYLNCPAGSLMI